MHQSMATRPGVLSAFVAALLLVPVQAQAQYFDPGSASIIIQAVLAGIVAVAATFKLYSKKIMGFFSRRRRDETPPTDPKSTRADAS